MEVMDIADEEFAGGEIVSLGDEVASLRPSSNIMQESVVESPENAADLRRKYNELIERCQNINKKDGVDDRIQAMISDNIHAGKALFQNVGSSPGSMYMAFLHTRVCTEKIRDTSEIIGQDETSGFKMDVFIESIRNRYNSVGGMLALTKEFSNEYACSSKALPTIGVVLGVFDSSTMCVPKPKEPEKKRAPRRKMMFNDANATQHEELTVQDMQRAQQDRANPETASKEAAKVLQAEYIRSGGPVNIYEFTLNNDLPRCVENLFYVAFMVRDGEAGLYRDAPRGSETGVNDANLAVTPITKKNDGEVQSSSNRKQYICSFSARAYKEMVTMLQGPSMIPASATSALNEIPVDVDYLHPPATPGFLNNSSNANSNENGLGSRRKRDSGRTSNSQTRRKRY